MANFHLDGKRWSIRGTVNCLSIIWSVKFKSKTLERNTSKAKKTK